MPLPSSGQIAFSNIATELTIASSNLSLRSMSSTAGKAVPDSISEFYGYSAPVAVDYLVVAGGAGGANDVYGGGGGGAGGYITGTATLTTGTYSVVVGGGGAGASGGGDSIYGIVGNLSSFYANSANPGLVPTDGPNPSFGAMRGGASGQGFAGGLGWFQLQPHFGAGGGGGATSVGGNGGLNQEDGNGIGGNGGSGFSNSITGASVFRAGGGGGGGRSIPGNASSGGGGGGTQGGTGTNGSPNTGGGGGGGGGALGAEAGTNGGGYGGSGVVILRYQGSSRATGGSITSSGGYTIHTFTGTANFVLS